MEDRASSSESSSAATIPAWYLDPVVAEHKRQTHLALLRRWLGPGGTGRILKTDLFEESNRIDQILFDPLFEPYRIFGFDLKFITVRGARDHPRAAGASVWVADVRHLPLRSESFDCVISTSTLDHFRRRTDLIRALDEIIRVIRPGGSLILTMDNPRNPLYWGLRIASRFGSTPFPLGVTASLGQLERTLKGKGLEVLGTDLLIHNPRGLSTLLFMAVRRMAGKSADRALRWLLARFDRLGAIPTRTLSACFVAVLARKPHKTVPGYTFPP